MFRPMQDYFALEVIDLSQELILMVKRSESLNERITLLLDLEKV